MKKRSAPHQFRVSLAQSVRTRLTLWYLAVMAFIIFLFGGSLYATQTFLNAGMAARRVETQLYRDSPQFASIYNSALLGHQACLWICCVDFRYDRGLLAGWQSAAPSENDYADG